MILADQATTAGQDGRVTDEQPGRPKRRVFAKAYQARILKVFDALPEGSAKRGALLRAERVCHSHVEHQRKQAGNEVSAASTGKPKKDAGSEEPARRRTEKKKLKASPTRCPARNDKLTGGLGKTGTALDIAGKAFALLEDISSSADSDKG